MFKPLEPRFILCALWLTATAAFAAPVFAAEAAPTGPTRLNAESMRLDGISGTHRYQGNAVLSQDNMQIAADEMTTQQNQDGKMSRAHFTGSPVTLTHRDPLTGAVSVATAKDVNYEQNGGLITLSGEAQIVQTESSIQRELTLKAAVIELTEINGQLTRLKARGTPASFAQTRADDLPVHGAANSISFDGEKQYLVLEGMAKLQRGQSTLEHSVIEYDGLTKVTIAPKREGEKIQFQLIQEKPAPKASDSQPATPQPEPNEPTP